MSLTPHEFYLVAVFLVSLFLWLLRPRGDNLVLLYAAACWLVADSWLAFTVISGFLVFGLISDGLISFITPPAGRS